MVAIRNFIEGRRAQQEAQTEAEQVWHGLTDLPVIEKCKNTWCKKRCISASFGLDVSTALGPLGFSFSGV